MRLHRQRANRVGAPRPAGQPASAVNGNLIGFVIDIDDTDSAAEEHDGRIRLLSAEATVQSAGEIEYPLALEEKLPFFRKKEAEPREVHLLLVVFHLCEVGVVGEIEGQTLSHTVFDVKPDVSLEIVLIRLHRGEVGV